MKFLLSFLSLVVLSAAAVAQEAADGSFWASGDGELVKLEVTDVGPGVMTNVVTGGGFSGAVAAVEGAHSTPANPTASSSQVMTTSSGAKYKVRNGRLCRMNEAGRFVAMRRAKRSFKGHGSGGTHRTPPSGGWIPWWGGEEIESLPIPR